MILDNLYELHLRGPKLKPYVLYEFDRYWERGAWLLVLSASWVVVGVEVVVVVVGVGVGVLMEMETKLVKLCFVRSLSRFIQ